MGNECKHGYTMGISCPRCELVWYEEQMAELQLKLKRAEFILAMVHDWWEADKGVAAGVPYASIYRGNAMCELLDRYEMYEEGVCTGDMGSLDNYIKTLEFLESKKAKREEKLHGQ